MRRERCPTARARTTRTPSPPGAAPWTALEQLPARQRVAVVLRYYEDLTEVQTAEAMGCAVGTVKSQVSAALAKLRAQVGDELFTGGSR